MHEKIEEMWKNGTKDINWATASNNLSQPDPNVKSHCNWEEDENESDEDE